MTRSDRRSGARRVPRRTRGVTVKQELKDSTVEGSVTMTTTVRYALFANFAGPRLGAGHSTVEQLDHAADLLTQQMLVEWRKQVRQRGIERPLPVEVTWRWAYGWGLTPEQLATFPRVAADPRPRTDTPDDSSDRDAVGLDEAGTVTQLHDQLYRKLDHGRLVVIGPAGAGKSGAMALLLLKALLQRTDLPPEDRHQVPVPVWLTMGSWQPHETDLRTWAITTIARDHPYLRAVTDFGSNAIEQLFDGARLALFLDGLDEMPRAARDRALTRLSEEGGGLPLVLTSRTDEFHKTLNSQAELPIAAVVMLHPVDPDAAAAYLTAAHHGSATQGWEIVAEHVRNHAGGVLTRVLNTPLMLTLARSAYTGRDPTQLLASELQDEATLRGHLLDQVLVTAYPDEAERRHAAYWLEWIAHHMTSRPGGPTRDLDWWDIPRWLTRRTRIPAALTVGLISGLVSGFTFGLVGGPMVGLAIGSLTGLAAGSTIGSMGSLRAPRTLIPRWPTPIEARVWLVMELVAGLLCGLGGSLAGILGLGLGLGIGLGLVFGLVSGLIGAILGVWGSATVGSPTATPRRLHRQDVRYGLVSGLGPCLLLVLIGGLVGGLYLGRVFGLMSGVAFGLMFGVAFGIISGVAFGFRSAASGRLRLAEAVLRRRHGGVRFLSFLDTASARQVLRQAGATYQFRHADLQDRLADRFSDIPADFGPDPRPTTPA